MLPYEIVNVTVGRSSARSRSARGQVEGDRLEFVIAPSFDRRLSIGWTRADRHRLGGPGVRRTQGWAELTAVSKPSTYGKNTR